MLKLVLSIVIGILIAIPWVFFYITLITFNDELFMQAIYTFFHLAGIGLIIWGIVKVNRS